LVSRILFGLSTVQDINARGAATPNYSEGAIIPQPSLPPKSYYGT